MTGSIPPRSPPEKRVRPFLPEAGIRLMERHGVGQLLIVHHDPLSTDQELLRREAALGRADVRFARQGDVIPIGSEAVS